MTRGDRYKLAKGLGFLSPWLLGFCLFTALPAGLSLYYSLCDYKLLKSPVFIGPTNYRLLMSDAVFWKSLTNTLYYALLAIPSGIAVALGLALLLNTKIRGRT